MSYDLAVFDPRDDLRECSVFLAWYEERTSWSGGICMRALPSNVPIFFSVPNDCSSARQLPGLTAMAAGEVNFRRGGIVAISDFSACRQLLAQETWRLVALRAQHDAPRDAYRP